MDALSGQPSIGHLKKMLHNLPVGLQALDEVYENALARLGNQDASLRDIAKRVLCWMTLAKRELSTAELRHAVATDIGMRDIDEDFLPEIEILDSVCAGLVTVDPKADVVRLVHYTTQEFLARHKFLQDGPDLIASTCAAYLSFDAFSEQVIHENSWNAEISMKLKSLFNKYALYPYAITFFTSHVQERVVSRNPELKALVIKLFKEPPKARLCYLSYHAVQRLSRFYNLGLDDISGLHLTVSIGSVYLIRLLLGEGCDPNAKDANDMTPLHHAVRLQKVKAIKVLGKWEGIQLDGHDKDGCSPLFYALNHKDATQGLEMARILIAAGANVNSRTPTHASLVQHAVWEWSDDVLQLLLLAGADPEGNDEEKLPLFDAFVGSKRPSRYHTMRLLLRAGADPNAPCQPYGSVMHAAAGCDRLALEVLLQHGGDVGCVDEDGQTPLFQSAWADNGDTAALILQQPGVDAARRNKAAIAALSVACARKRRPDVARVILESGALTDPFDLLGFITLRMDKAHRLLPDEITTRFTPIDPDIALIEPQYTYLRKEVISAKNHSPKLMTALRELAMDLIMGVSMLTRLMAETRVEGEGKGLLVPYIVGREDL